MSRVLITGGTGVVGSALTPLFLGQRDVAVHLLVRARDEAHLEERRRALFAFWGEAVAAEDAGKRLFLHRGDVSRSRLGLSETAFEELAEGLTHIVHAAASVRMDMGRAEAQASCVTPVEQVLALYDQTAARGSAPKLEAVSTLGVAGRLKGLIPEAAELPPRDFHNTYEWAKAEAERLLLARIAEGARITLHRPSMVVGDGTSGKVIHRQIFYYLCRFLSGSATRGLLPDLGGVTLDLVPSDYIARAIHWSATAGASEGRVLHLCAGAKGAVPVMTLAERVRATWARHGQPLPRPRVLPFTPFETGVALAARLPGRSGRRFSALRRFLAHAHVAQVFANDETQALLAPAIGPAPGYEAFLEAQLDAVFGDETAAGRAAGGSQAAPRKPVASYSQRALP